MSRSAVALLLATLGVAGCSSFQTELPADVWLCAYQVGDRYRDEAVKPDIVKYDLVSIAPVRRITINYLLPTEGHDPERHSVTCESSPSGFSTVAIDGLALSQPLYDTRHEYGYNIATSQGSAAAGVRESVRKTGVHVHIPGIDGF